MAELIRLTSDEASSVVRVNHISGAYIGDIIQKEDGYFDFWPVLNGGYWDQYTLLDIANTLKELNKPYEKELEKYFSEGIEFSGA